MFARNILEFYSTCTHYFILYRRLQQVGFRWHRWSPRRPPPLPLCRWERLLITHVEGAFPTYSLRDHHSHKHTWLKCHRCIRVYTFISLSLSSTWPISRPRSSRCRSPGCKLPYSLIHFHRHSPSPSCPSPHLKASPHRPPKYRRHQCPWLRLCSPVVAPLYPQMAPQLLQEHFAPPLHPPPTRRLLALLLLCLPVPKFSQLPPPRLFLWDKNKTKAKCELNVKVQEMEIQSGSGHTGDPFGVLVICVHVEIVTVTKTWIPAYIWMRWGRGEWMWDMIDPSMYGECLIRHTAAGVYKSWYVWVFRCINS